MSTLREFQHDFRRALLADSWDRVESAFAAGAVPVATGLRVYRNNIFAKLSEALADLYPVVERLVGDEFFRYTARAFVVRHPPRNAILADYGSAFPEFLESFAPANSVPYLADVARLELARHQASQATDATPLTPQDLKTVPNALYGDVRLTLHPSSRLVASPYPIDAIWAVNQPDNRLEAVVDLPERGAHLFVVRPRLSVMMKNFTKQEFDFLCTLNRSTTLAEAHAAAGPGWDPQMILTDLIAMGAFVDWNLCEV